MAISKDLESMLVSPDLKPVKLMRSASRYPDPNAIAEAAKILRSANRPSKEGVPLKVEKIVADIRSAMDDEDIALAVWEKLAVHSG